MVDGGAGLAAGDGEPLEQPGAYVGEAERGELLVGVDLVAVLGGERAGQQDALGIGQQGNADCRRQQGVDLPQSAVGKAKPGNPRGNAPTTATFRPSRPSTREAAIAVTTTTRAGGIFGATRSEE